MLLNCGVGEDSWESLGLQGDATSPSLKEVSPGCSLEGLMLKLKLQCFGYLIRRADSFEKDPDAGKDWGQEEKGTTEDEMVGWHHWLNGRGFGWTPGVGDGQGGTVHGVAKSQTWLNNWAELNWKLKWNTTFQWQAFYKYKICEIKSFVSLHCLIAKNHCMLRI